MRAVTTLLELKAANQSAKLIAVSVMKRISPLLDLTEHMMEIIEEVTKHTKQAADRIFSMCEEARDEINRATDCACNELSPVLENVKSDMSKIMKEIHTTTTRTENQDENRANMKGMSPMYADTLNRQLPTSHAGTLA